MTVVRRRHFRLGAVFVVVGFAAMGAVSWLEASDLKPSALVAGVAASKVRAAATGSVREILVRDGETVAPGALVARLDDLTPRSELQSLTGRADTLLVRRARLHAELAGAVDVGIPAVLGDRAVEPAVRDAIAAERVLLETRATMRARRIELQRQRIDCFKDQIRAYEAQARAKARESALVEEELKGARELRAKQLVPVTRLRELEREAARLAGDRDGWLAASIADAHARIADAELNILQADQDHRREVAQELKETSERLAELERNRASVEQSLRSAEVRTLQGGIVRRAVKAGAIVRPGEDVMEIVPPGSPGACGMLACFVSSLEDAFGRALRLISARV